MQLAHKNTKQDEASCCQMVTLHGDAVLQDPERRIDLWRKTAGEESPLQTAACLSDPTASARSRTRRKRV